MADIRRLLESIISLFEQGSSAEEIALRYDVLDPHDVYATLSSFLGHQQRYKNTWIARVKGRSGRVATRSAGW